MLSEDEVLHQRYLSGLAESFDAWSIHAYRFEGDAVFVVQRLQVPERTNAVVASVPEEEFQTIAERALDAYGEFPSN